MRRFDFTDEEQNAIAREHFCHSNPRVQRPPKVVAEACDRIEKLTGVRRQPTQMRMFLRETRGLRCRKVASFLGLCVE